MMKKLTALVVVLMLVLGGAASADVYYEDFEAQTPLFGSSAGKISNIELAAEQLSGTVLLYGDEFSFNDVIGPRTKEEGYRSARNGRGAVVMGGGVSQLASTLYLAVRDCDYMTIEPFRTYGERFAEWYVDDGEDAVVTDYAAGYDFAFTSWYDGVVVIDAWTDEDYVYVDLLFDEEYDGYDGALISSASTPLFGSDNKLENIALASEAIYGTELEWGDEFSFNEIVGPRSTDAGYLKALNGRGVKVVGGGVAQVASTVYLAVKELECVSVDPVKTYGDRFTDGYVSDSRDAIVTDYNAGTDFSFTYWGDGVLSVLVYEEDDRLVCEIFEE